MMMQGTTSKFEHVLVIGAGQAGLAAGYWLKQDNISFEILETEIRIGTSWRRRYASLSLFTTREFSALPGLSLSGDPEGYAGRDEFADYLETYATHFGLPVRLGVSVVTLRRDSAGLFTALLSTGASVRASQIIVATGGFQQPLVPVLASGFGPEVLQLTPEDFGDGASVPAGTVLVVGDGASGRDLAVLARKGHEVLLATGKPRKMLPERIFGKSIWWWLRRLGLLSVSGSSRIGRLMQRKDPFPDRDRSLKSLAARGIVMMPRLLDAKGGEAVFEGGQSHKIAAVVWAVGYRDQTDWLQVRHALDDQGRFLQEEGVSPVSGLYFLGQPWQRNRASALVMGVGDDARQIVKAITATRDQSLGARAGQAKVIATAS
ncbi:MAG: flavin-containing monooxygenase [Alcaligenes sp.]